MQKPMKFKIQTVGKINESKDKLFEKKIGNKSTAKINNLLLEIKQPRCLFILYILTE